MFLSYYNGLHFYKAHRYFYLQSCGDLHMLNYNLKLSSKTICRHNIKRIMYDSDYKGSPL